MTTDAPNSGFQAGRVSLRETAKWMVTGVAGIAALIIGSSTLSQLGAMDVHGWRFKLAIGALLTASCLCWIPFSRAIAVLRSEVMSLRIFTDATKGDFHTAAQNVSTLVQVDLPDGQSLHEFVAQYIDQCDDLRQRIETETDDEARAQLEQDLTDLEDLYQSLRQACFSELVKVRFDALIRSFAFPGIVILGAFVVFTWAANPAKDETKLFEHPYVESLTPSRTLALKQARVAAACLAPGAQLIAIAAPEAGPQTAILTGPGCAPVKVTLSGGEIVKVSAP